MSLRSLTEKIDGYIQGAALLLTIGTWAAFGFAFISELIGFGCLLIISIIVVVIHQWMTSRP